MSIDVPKQLGVQQISIRALHLSYDDCDIFRPEEVCISVDEIKNNEIPELLMKYIYI